MRSLRSERSLALGVVALVFVALAVVGCRTSSPARPSAPGPGPTEATFDSRPLPERVRDPEKVRRIEAAALRLRPVEAWREQPILRQRVRIDWRGRSESFEAVLQRRPGELALLGLGPMNLVGFRLALVAGEGAAGEERVVFENRSGRELPFTPTHMLADVQRVFYPWLADAPACADCERRGERDGLSVVEQRAGQRLATRRFTIGGLPEAGVVGIRYADWRGEPAIPYRVEVENGWFGYRLTIETLEALASGAPNATDTPAAPSSRAAPAAPPTKPSRR